MEIDRSRIVYLVIDERYDERGIFMNCVEITGAGIGMNGKKNITPLIKNMKKAVELHCIKAGVYSRYRDEEQPKMNAYGCADAANILYTINEFPRDIEERKQWVEALQSMQEKDTGLFVEGSHFPLHTTAHCAAALELFDAAPLYPMTALEPYKTKEGLYAFLEALQWEKSPWNNSHMGAGIYVAMNMAEEATPEWNQWYFDWYYEEADPITGLWRKGYADRAGEKIYEHMAGSFHYLFNHEYANMPLRYPEKMIDTCLEMYEKKHIPVFFGKGINFIEMDWVYCITRALRQCGHRFEECVIVLKNFADSYIDYLMTLDPEKSDEFNDLHMLFGALCCVTELQQFLKGYLYSEKPLRLVLDRRPFI